ncbi:hypothetical protein HNQ59_002721 [Chitinivorax tropicus]|uniref:Alpha/beta hydrolase n=1 Tax=Chitinivorax tropicus TaxID=714531 RepID=A0A840MQR4_9PROT|nr:hypothetical protein [Chitinivorax tropicus]MBB5019419.1 hypothetical protein [Chitinivorax tropicus]
MTDRDPPVRNIKTSFEKNGRPNYKSMTSSSSFTTRAACTIQSDIAIPIILLPGVMGTNLRSKDTQKLVWRPPNDPIEGLLEGFSRWFQSAKSRQESMVPSQTEVDPRGWLHIPDENLQINEEEAKIRGWGEVHWDSYGDFMMYLEAQLNSFYFSSLPSENPSNNTLHDRICQEVGAEWDIVLGGDQTGTPSSSKEQKTYKDFLKWGPQNEKSFTPLSVDEHKHLRGFYFPVHAVGFNWLESCEQSAKRLESRILEIKARYESSETKGSCPFKVPGVILITHSMGGFVARRCQQLPGVGDLILGVVHGVMPVNGAPVIYRRLRAGTEVLGKGLGIIESFFTAKVIGWSAEDITCVMANSPGALELLPNRHYNNGKPWLELRATMQKKNEKRDRCKETTVNLPIRCPYDEIYRQETAWWRMVDQSLINPAKSAHHNAEGEQLKISDWDSYLMQLAIAEEFHEKLHPSYYGNFTKYHNEKRLEPNTGESKRLFHPNSYMHFGVDKEKKAYGVLTWFASELPFKLTEQQLKDGLILPKSNHLGALTVSLPDNPGHLFKFNICECKTCDGDVVVPENSFSSLFKNRTPSCSCEADKHGPLQGKNQSNSTDGASLPNATSTECQATEAEGKKPDPGQGQGIDQVDERFLLKQIFLIKGPEHASSYKKAENEKDKCLDDIRRTVLYSIGKIASTVPLPNRGE